MISFNIARTRLASLLLPLALAASSSALAAHWPAWRGPDGTGVSTEKHLPTRWSATENIRWKVALPERGNSTPIIWGDRVFVAQPAGNERTLMCFDRAGGKLLWQKGVTYTAPDATHEANPYCSASPATDGERVIVWFGSAGVVCYDMQGAQLWKRDLGKQSHEWGYGSSPILHGDLCILYFGPGPGSFLTALDKQTGKTVWRVEEPLVEPRKRTDGFKGKEPGIIGTFTSPILIRAAGRDELVMSFPQQLRAYDPKTGAELWHCDGLNELIYASPLAADGVVVGMGGYFGNSIAVKPGGKGDVTATHRLWQSVRTKTGIGSGVIHDGHIFIMTGGARVQCLDLKTGNEVWLETARGKGATGDSWSSMTLADGKLYVLNQGGDCVVLKASPKFELLAANSLGNERADSSVAVSNGDLFIHTHKHLWCVSEGGVRKTALR